MRNLPKTISTKQRSFTSQVMCIIYIRLGFSYIDLSKRMYCDTQSMYSFYVKRKVDIVEHTEK